MVGAVARLKRIDAVVEADWWVEFAWLNHHIIIIHCHLLIVIFQLWSVVVDASWRLQLDLDRSWAGRLRTALSSFWANTLSWALEFLFLVDFR